MKALVLGAGMMGAAVAYDLAMTEPRASVTLADINANAAAHAARSIGGGVDSASVDVLDTKALLALFDGYTVVVSAVSYSVNAEVSRAAIEAGVSLCDLGGNDDVVNQQLALHDEASKRGVLIVPNCGLAPGLVNVLAVSAAEAFETIDAIHLRVGGLPQHPHPPLQYQLVFSAEGLLNEYIEPSEVIRNGQVVRLPSMHGLEDITFPPPFGTLEAFLTSGGASLLPRLFQGRVRELDYKTIRYKGHCERFRTLLELGFADNEPLQMGHTLRTRREYFIDLLRKKLDTREPDVVLARVTAEGIRHGRRCSLTHEFIDYYDTATGMSAMMRTTAFPTAIIARLMADGTIDARGVMPPEQCVPGKRLVEELSRRNIRITTTLAEQ